MKSVKVSRRLLASESIKNLSKKNTYRIEATGRVVATDVQWGRGTRNDYWYVGLITDRMASAYLQENYAYQTEEGHAVIETSVFCGTEVSPTIHCRADDVPLLFGLPRVEGMPLEVYADRLEEEAGEQFKGQKRKFREEVAAILRELAGVANRSA